MLPKIKIRRELNLSAGCIFEKSLASINNTFAIRDDPQFSLRVGPESRQNRSQLRPKGGLRGPQKWEGDVVGVVFSKKDAVACTGQKGVFGIKTGSVSIGPKESITVHSSFVVIGEVMGGGTVTVVLRDVLQEVVEGGIVRENSTGSDTREFQKVPKGVRSKW